MTTTSGGSEPYRDRLRDDLAAVGLTGQCLTEQVAADLASQGMQPLPASRYASELSLRVAAMQFNEITCDPRAPMTANRIWDFERPSGSVQPTVRKLTILARIYAAGRWLRRTTRDPSVNPWLLLDQLTAPGIILSGPHTRPLGGSGARLVSADSAGRGRAG